MSAEHNSIQCTHGLGLKCRICYDQCFGLDWDKTRKGTGLDDKAFTDKLVGVVPPLRRPHHHPFLSPLAEE